MPSLDLAVRDGWGRRGKEEILGGGGAFGEFKQGNQPTDKAHRKYTDSNLRIGPGGPPYDLRSERLAGTFDSKGTT